MFSESDIELIATLISGIGTIIALWGIFEWGISFQSTNGEIQSNALKRIAGGVFMMLAQAILTELIL